MHLVEQCIQKVEPTGFGELPAYEIEKVTRGMGWGGQK